MSLKGTEMTKEEYLRIRVSLLEKEAAAAEKSLRKYTVQRNIAVALCTVFLALTIYFASRPIQATESESPPLILNEQQEVVVTEQNYVSSVNSDKYHRPTCDYAENILEENRVYYATAREAEAAGKQACSVCRP